MTGGAGARCPWCGALSSCAGWSERNEGETFVVECDGCGRAFLVSYELSPDFTVELPRAMRACYADWSDELMCPYWGVNGNCAFDKIPSWLRDEDVNRGCPLGHGRGEREDGR